MSLVSAKNFAGPFSNKTHLVTMILIAALFGAYRVAGGGISTERKGGAHKSQVVDKPAVAKKVIGQDPGKTMPQESGSNLIVEMIGAERADEKPAKEAAATGGNKDWDELEKSLGIR